MTYDLFHFKAQIAYHWNYSFDFVIFPWVLLKIQAYLLSQSFFLIFVIFFKLQCETSFFTKALTDLVVSNILVVVWNFLYMRLISLSEETQKLMKYGENLFSLHIDTLVKENGLALSMGDLGRYIKRISLWTWVSNPKQSLWHCRLSYEIPVKQKVWTFLEGLSCTRLVPDTRICSEEKNTFSVF